MSDTRWTALYQCPIITKNQRRPYRDFAFPTKEEALKVLRKVSKKHPTYQFFVVDTQTATVEPV